MPLFYRPLIRGIDDIRLLELLPAIAQQNQLAVRLFHSKFNVEYEALSYAWDDQIADGGQVEVHYALESGDAQPISKYCIHVGKNLYSALKCLRHPTEARTLWIDTICINQQDDVEKSAQVQMMSKIFAEAKQVLAWLGPGNPQTDQAISAMQDVSLEVRKLYTSWSTSKFSDLLDEYCLGWVWGPLLMDWRRELL